MNNKWRIEQVGGGQIADTGDYDDPIYLLTNGDIELVTEDDVDLETPDIDSIHTVIRVLNNLDYKWEDWKADNKDLEIHILKDQLKQWQKVAEQMYEAMDHLEPTDIEYCDQAWKAIQNYEELK